MADRKHCVAAVLLLAGVLVTGCEKKEEEVWVPVRPDAVTFDAEGHVTEYLSEELEQVYYSFAELDDMLQEEVADYNAACGQERIQVIDASADGRHVSLTLQYDSWRDVAAFNQISFYYGSMIGAQLAGFLFDGSYLQVQDGKLLANALPGSAVLAHMDEMVVVSSIPMEIHVPGTVTFVSNGFSLLAPDVAADLREEDAQEESAAAAWAGQPGYVVFDDRR